MKGDLRVAFLFLAQDQQQFPAKNPIKNAPDINAWGG